MKAHKLAKYFPILEGDEFKMLVEDIRKNGQLNPIVTYKGEITVSTAIGLARNWALIH